MNIIECQQGSVKWHAARLGIPTASRFAAIVTPKGAAVTGKARHTYMMELLAERILGRAADHYVSKDMERGTRLEPEARDWYADTYSEPVDQVGFVMADDGRYGASPDGLIGHGGCMEIKVPTVGNHIGHLVMDEVPKQWQVQIQGELWVCERELCAFVMYCDEPNVPNMVKTVERDDAVIDALEENVPLFCDQLDQVESHMRERYGMEPRKEIKLDKLSGDWCPWTEGDEIDVSNGTMKGSEL